MLLYIIFAVLVGHITCATGIIISGEFATPQPVLPLVILQSGLKGSLGDTCSGALISDSVVVATGNCTFGKDPSEMKAVFDATDLPAVDIAEIITHPLYDPKSRDYDISLIRLSNAVPLGTWAPSIIKMVSPETIMPANNMAVICGFGSIYPSNKLKCDGTQLWSPDLCNAQYDPRITDRMICADNPSGPGSSCGGDSGVLLTVNGELLGLPSWGPAGGAKGPCVYTRVVHFVEWIKQNLEVKS